MVEYWVTCVVTVLEALVESAFGLATAVLVAIKVSGGHVVYL